MKELEELKAIIKSYGRMVVAFSGGTDSTFLAAVARDVLGDDLLLVHINSIFITHKEKAFAQIWSQENNFNMAIIELDPLQVPEVRANCEYRCYYCKREIMKRIVRLAKEQGFNVVADGTNVDDINAHRPGLKASQENKIAHPLADAGFTKELIRAAAEEYRLPNCHMPSSACLATRIPTGIPLTVTALKMVSAAEKCLDDLEISGSRVRIDSDTAKIEVNPAFFPKLMNYRQQIVDELKSIGFKQIVLDLQGYRQTPSPPKKK